MRFRLFGGTEHSDSIPLDVVSPVAELRSYLRGEIDREAYDRALVRSDEALSAGWPGHGDSEPEDRSAPTTASRA